VQPSIKLRPERKKVASLNNGSTDPKNVPSPRSASAEITQTTQNRVNGRYTTTNATTFAEKSAPSEPTNESGIGFKSRSPHCSSSQSAIDEKKTAKQNNNRLRVATELEAALVMHKAGVECWVKKSVVCAVRGWSRATLYRRVADNYFPKPRKRNRSSEWRIADVIAS
jgi:hypothetical protein